MRSFAYVVFYRAIRQQLNEFIGNDVEYEDQAINDMIFFSVG